jgi:heat shock protein HtpX
MFEDFPGAAAFAAAIALAPAIQRWWGGRALARLTTDPVLPERLNAHRVRSTGTSLLVFAFLVAGWPMWLFWTVPLQLISCGLANYRLRKIMFEETWGRIAYLSFCARALVALFGFWIAIAALPTLARFAGSGSWVVAVSVGIALVAWNARYGESVRFILRSRPIPQGPLLARFTSLAQACNTRMPAFEQIDLKGGSIANAIALPSVERPAVVFTDTLLARLDADEAAAICAHELAHLEHYNPACLRRLNLETYALIAGSVAVVALSPLLFASSLIPTAIWSCFVVVAMAWRVRNRQKHETESDVRAVALTGDPDALARALVKLHALAHIPRRFDAPTEQRSTHPSLATRIRDIRAAAEKPPPALSADVSDVSFRAANGTTHVTFEEERLQWREGEAAVHGLSYAHLTELRLDAKVSGPASLVVVERAGRRWQMPLDAVDVARAQAVLDLVDTRLPKPAPPAMAWPEVGRAVAIVAACVALAAFQLSAAVVALIAMARPAPPLFAAAGCAALAAAGLVLRDPSMISVDIQPWLTIGLAAAGIIMSWNAWTRRDDPASAEVKGFVVLLAAMAGLAFAAVFLHGANPLRLNQGARAVHAAAVLPLALGGALVCWSRPAARVGAAAAVLAGLLAAGAGTIAFLDRFSNDPLLVASERFTRIELDEPPASAFELPFYASDVRLSPGAVYIAALGNGGADGDYGQWPKFHVGRLGSRLSAVDANDFVFLDDAHALVMVAREDGVELKKLALETTPQVVWQQYVPEIFGPDLSIGSDSRWRLMGSDRLRQPLRVEGLIGSAEVHRTGWKGFDHSVSWPAAMGASGSDALIVLTSYDARIPTSAWALIWLLNPGAVVSQLWHVGPENRTQLGVSHAQAQCDGGVLGDERVVCIAYDGVRSRITALDPATGRITPIGTLDGHFTTYGRAPAGWLTGWCDSTPAAIRLGTREIFMGAQDRLRVSAVTAADRWFAAISGDEAVTIRLFPLDAE